MRVDLTINKKSHSLELQDNETLLEVLRDRLTMTGTKTACQESECGTCTVMIESGPIRRKSRCRGLSVTGSTCTSRGRTS